MKRRMRLILDRLYPAMLDRIMVDVIHVPRIILIVADSMLPKPSLPDTPFSTVRANGGTRFIGSNCVDEANLDGFPSIGEIRVAVG